MAKKSEREREKERTEEPELQGFCSYCGADSDATAFFSGWNIDQVELCPDCFADATMEE